MIYSYHGQGEIWNACVNIKSMIRNVCHVILHNVKPILIFTSIFKLDPSEDRDYIQSPEHQALDSQIILQRHLKGNGGELINMDLICSYHGQSDLWNACGNIKSMIRNTSHVILYNIKLILIFTSIFKLRSSVERDIHVHVFPEHQVLDSQV